MFHRHGITIRTVQETDRQGLANLIHFETRVHRHLDWRPPLDWVGSSPYLVAERSGNPVAVLVCPPDPPGTAWIRLFAVSSRWSVTQAWQALWTEAQNQLCSSPGTRIASIPLQEWYQSLLVKSHFHHTYDVTLLSWQPGIRLPVLNDLPFEIRPMTIDDLPAIQGVDELAFEPLWQNSIESLKYAFRQAAVATVAEDGSGFLGYQISTASPMGGHLARLAVYPRSQRKGIGYALLCDLLNQFERRGAGRVTVNTQQHNLASLALYQKAGFRPTGEVYPVYQYT